jgi:hypothetical protein
MLIQPFASPLVFVYYFTNTVKGDDRNMKEARNCLKGESHAVSTSTSNQQSTLKEIAEMSLEAFWKQESRYINQVLHRLLGKKRFLLLDGEIIGVAEVNRRQRSHT